MSRPSIICGIANAITVLAAAFIFLHYIFHETTGSDAKEMNSEEVEQFRHHKRVLPESEHFTNVSLIQKHYCPAQESESDPCLLKAFSYCGNYSRSASLTFDVDQHWTKESLNGIMEELKGVQITATFFLSGQDSIDHEDRCEQIQTLVQSGHEVQIMNWNGAELHSDQPIETLGIDQALEFFSNCLRKPSWQSFQFRPVRGKITLEQARLVSRRYDMAIAMWSLSSDPDRVEHLIDLADDAVALNESIVIRCQDPEYWSRSGPILKLVSYFQEHKYRFLSSNHCYEQCSSRLCLTPQSW